MADHSAFAGVATAASYVNDDAPESYVEDRAAAKRRASVVYLQRVLDEAELSVQRAERKLVDVTADADSAVGRAAECLANAEADRMKALEGLAAAEAADEGAN